MKRTIVSLLLVLCLMVFAIPAMSVEADAATTYTSGDWTYSVDSGVATITKYSGTASAVTIPRMMDNLYLITAIGEKAFQGNVTMKSVSFPDTLTSIGNRAFSGCVALQSVTLPAKLATLGELSFENCFSLETITVKSTALNDIRNTVNFSDAQPFYQAGIGTSGITVVFSSGVTRIPAAMFYARSGDAYAPNITSVKIADSVTTIGNQAFEGCVFLETVDFGNGVQSIGEKAFYGCSALTNITFPTRSLTTIHKNAFSNCTKLAKLVLPNALTTIGEAAFQGNTAMTSVSFPDTLASIGYRAFSGCAALKSVTLPVKLATLGELSFENCFNIETITVKSTALNDIKNTVNFSDAQPFYQAGINTSGITVVFSSGVTRIPAAMFYARSGDAYAANITSVEIADSVTTIGNQAFEGCVFLKTVDCGNGVQSIGEKAFSGCSALTSVAFPEDSLLKISASAFANCTKLPSVDLPDTLTDLGNYAFENCVGFSSITLPVNVANLGQRTFQGCTNVSRITINSAALNDIANNSGTNGSPFYNVGSATDGVAVTFGSTCTKIPARLFNAFADPAFAANIVSVTIPNSVTYIGDSAFRSCTNLRTVTMGNGVTRLDSCAFENCYALTTITYSNVLTEIKDHAFYSCTSLKSGTLPTALTTIGEYAFENCNALTSVTLPKDLSSLGQRAFQNCQNISKITVKSTDLKDINNSYNVNGQPFYCAGTESSGIVVVFTDGVTRIPANLFGAHSGVGYAPNIKEVTVAATVSEIGSNAFLNCNDLASIQFLGDAPTISSNAFSGITTTAYYPSNPTWTADLRQNYGGSITWVALKTELAITKQPATGYAQSGKTVSVSVEAEGDGLTYQWYIKNDGASKYSKSSITSATYTCTMSSKTRDRLVYCVVTDQYGETIKSNTVRLRMAATITKEPVNASAASGSSAKVSLTAVGDGLTYQWYVKNPGKTTFSKSSVVKSSYSCKMSSSTDGRQVYCIVTDKYGNSDRSETVTFGLPVKITTQPKTTYTQSGETAKVTLKADGDGLKYQWYIKNSGATKYSKSSITSATYTCTMSSKTKDRLIYCVVTDQYGNEVKSNTVRLRMAATITKEPVSVTVDKGDTAKVTVKATGDGLTYKWYYKNPGESKYSYTSSFKGNSYSVTMSASRDGRKVYCVVTDKYGNEVRSKTVSLNMD